MFIIWLFISTKTNKKRFFCNYFHNQALRLYIFEKLFVRDFLLTLITSCTFYHSIASFCSNLALLGSFFSKCSILYKFGKTLTIISQKSKLFETKKGFEICKIRLHGTSQKKHPIVPRPYTSGFEISHIYLGK